MIIKDYSITCPMMTLRTAEPSSMRMSGSLNCSTYFQYMLSYSKQVYEWFAYIHI